MVGIQYKATYTYDADGLLIAKTNAQTGAKITIYRNGSLITGIEENGVLTRYFYDASGSILGFEKNGATYYYIKNLQNDVTGITDAQGNLIGTYRYDAWGNPLGIYDASGATSYNSLMKENPFRYRGYYYDTLSGLYYLNSRYYSPELKRFISADGYVSTGQGITGYNMFAYCGNNPVNKVDYSGESGIAFTIGGIAAWKLITAAIAIIGIAGIAITSITTIQSSSKTVSSSTTGTKSYTKTETSVSTKTEIKRITEDTPIYRHGGTNPGNLTPSKKDLRGSGGLSFSTIPSSKNAKTTIRELNATGLVYAVQDGATHISVYPIGGSLDEWYAAGPSSAWTLAVKSAVIKWDGGPT